MSRTLENRLICTCDVSFFRKAKSISGLKTKVVSPIELIEEVESWQ